MATAETTNGAAVSAAMPNGEHEDSGGFKLKFATVCASNQNRHAHSAPS